MAKGLKPGDGGEMIVEMAAHGVPGPRALDPVLRRARTGEADQLAPRQQRPVAFAAERRVAEAHAEHPFDIALEHGRRRIEPKRIEEGEQIGIGEGGALGDHVRPGGEVVMARQLLGVQHRVEPHAIEVAQIHLGAFRTRRLGIGLGHGQGEASAAWVRDDEHLLHAVFLQRTPSHVHSAASRSRSPQTRSRSKLFRRPSEPG
ncbi:hypothetical protein D3C77_291020 [compost metagenome]